MSISNKIKEEGSLVLSAVVAPPGGGLGDISPNSRQDQFSNSSRFTEKMSGLRRGTSSKILKWA